MQFKLNEMQGTQKEQASQNEIDESRLQDDQAFNDKKQGSK